MRLIRGLHEYLTALTHGKVVLWCYLIWYLVTAVNYFDPTPAIWINSLGISVVIGIALVLSVGGDGTEPLDRWQTFRLFLMPFCVSSFSSLIKGRDFILILPPRAEELAFSIGACAAFVLVVALLKQNGGNSRIPPGIEQ